MMKKKLPGLLPYAAALAAAFYLLPCLTTDTGAAMVMMLCVIPMTAFFTAVIYGVRRGFDLLLPAAAMLLFAPTVLLFYNETAWPYVIIYGGIVLAGNGAGRIFHERR
jgi:hypothetical protein